MLQRPHGKAAIHDGSAACGNSLNRRVLAIMKAYREAFGVSWQWAASVAVIVSAPLVVTVTFGTWADVVRVLIVLLPPAIVGIINPCGIILAVPAGWCY